MDVVFITTTSEKLDSVPVVNGQIIALSDVDAYYYDQGGQRRCAASHIVVDSLPGVGLNGTTYIVDGSDPTTNGLYTWKNNNWLKISKECDVMYVTLSNFNSDDRSFVSDKSVGDIAKFVHEGGTVVAQVDPSTILQVTESLESANIDTLYLTCIGSSYDSGDTSSAAVVFRGMFNSTSVSSSVKDGYDVVTNYFVAKLTDQRNEYTFETYSSFNSIYEALTNSDALTFDNLKTEDKTIVGSINEVYDEIHATESVYIKCAVSDDVDEESGVRLVNIRDTDKWAEFWGSTSNEPKRPVYLLDANGRLFSWIGRQSDETDPTASAQMFARVGSSSAQNLNSAQLETIYATSSDYLWFETVEIPKPDSTEYQSLRTDEKTLLGSINEVYDRANMSEVMYVTATLTDDSGSTTLDKTYSEIRAHIDNGGTVIAKVAIADIGTLLQATMTVGESMSPGPGLDTYYFPIATVDADQIEFRCTETYFSVSPDLTTQYDFVTFVIQIYLDAESCQMQVTWSTIAGQVSSIMKSKSFASGDLDTTDTSIFGAINEVNKLAQEAKSNAFIIPITVTGACRRNTAIKFLGIEEDYIPELDSSVDYQDVDSAVNNGKDVYVQITYGDGATLLLPLVAKTLCRINEKLVELDETAEEDWSEYYLTFNGSVNCTDASTEVTVIIYISMREGGMLLADAVAVENPGESEIDRLWNHVHGSKPNWEESSPDECTYIENRTHYTDYQVDERYYLYGRTYLGPSTYGLSETTQEIVAGDKYIVDIRNGYTNVKKKVACVAKNGEGSDFEGYICLGEHSIESLYGDDGDYEFAIVNTAGGWTLYLDWSWNKDLDIDESVLEDYLSICIQHVSGEIVHKLDAKYLPDDEEYAISFVNKAVVELTQEEYDALSEEEKNNGKIYLVQDSGAEESVLDIIKDTVIQVSQDEYDKLSETEKAEKVYIVSGGVDEEGVKEVVKSLHVEITKAEYEALSEEEKHNGCIYFITDDEVNYEEDVINIIKENVVQVSADEYEALTDAQKQSKVYIVKDEIATSVCTLGDATLRRSGDTLDFEAAIPLTAGETYSPNTEISYMDDGSAVVSSSAGLDIYISAVLEEVTPESTSCVVVPCRLTLTNSDWDIKILQDVEIDASATSATLRFRMSWIDI